MTTTQNYGLELPDPANDVDEEFYRLQQTLAQLDAIIFALKQLVDQKAASQHGHAQADIIGLVDALAAKMNADKTFSLDDLTDVDGAAAAAVNYLLVRGADGQWRPSSAAAAIGAHQHQTGDIVGLSTLITNTIVAAFGGDPDFAVHVLADLSARLPKAGGSMTGDIDMAGKKLLNLSSINGGATSPYRNKLRNGGFDIWQRGFNFANPGNGAYTADGWKVLYDVAGTFTVSAVGASNEAINPQTWRYLRWQQTVAAVATTRNLISPMENVRTLAGQTVTVTFEAWAAAAANLGVWLRQNFGTGGSPSPSVATAVTTLALTTVPQKFSVTFSLADVKNKTVGTNVNDCLELIFNMPLTGTFDIKISRVSVVAGDATQEADPFSPRSIQQDLSFCQRYYEKTFRFTGQQVKNAGNNWYLGHPWIVQKRVTPGIGLIFTSNVNTSVPSFAANEFGYQVSSTKDGANGEASISWEIYGEAEL
ncbi:hypothetical protein [Rhizobium sp. S163]|uniref:hypothetical protein n=1 Tax=Rhizobium sp. S163 TaxID=3055039 RepID=UPI0025A95A9E|nr:hypothetical protein [Rhizobium sp. S163]MDM9647759.1 hypothetical protein [Rhizobium sp. S163]